MERRRTPCAQNLPFLATRRNQTPWWVLVLLLLGPGILLAQEPSSQASSSQLPSSEGGQVEIPLEVYNQLVERSRQPSEARRPAPARYALGKATVNLAVSNDDTPHAVVTTELSIDVLEDGWSLVPVLPSGTAVAKVEVDGATVQLMASAEGLAWAAQRRGTYQMSITYRVGAQRSAAGWSLAIPTPEAAALSLSANWPTLGLDVAVIPSAGMEVSTASGTRVTATVPSTRGVQVTWRRPISQEFTLSRARYRGALTGDAVTWQATFDVEVWHEGTVTLPLLAEHVTLSEVLVDGKPAPILLQKHRFATLVQGSGEHQVQLSFEVPVLRDQGPPRLLMDVPAVPVSQFELTLPGKKEVTAEPASHVEQVIRGGNTIATANVAMSSEVTMTWTEAVPDEVQAEVRANAAVYHLVHAEEGVLYVRALVDYDVSRGETSQLRFAVPSEVQVNRVSEASGAVADWRLSRNDQGQEIRVFLNRQLQGALQLDIAYDRSLAKAEQDATTAEDPSALRVPLLQAVESQRQRGMVALLQSKDLTLEPLADQGATRVGENQLPAFVRQLSAMTVAHTFKYVEELPEIEAKAAKPERKQGRFDARVDTLLSLGEVTLKGASSLEIDIKSGHIMELDLDLPRGANLLALTGPSIRDHEVMEGEDAQQRVHIEFTQEMAGQFRIEAAYERLLVDGEELIDVPTLKVRGAEVEQGRLALEALSAVEVGVEAAEQLTALDINELPQQLVLRTTNPILMAYKYVGPPYRLALRITHHDLVDVQEAAIDEARYRTLFTRDGLAVTTASFQVRNSREQFLRVKLPKGSKVWSVFVDGQPVKPALASDEDGEWYLIKIIHSTRGFPVEMIYQTEGGPIQGLGTVAARLPRPEILVTRSRWDVYVPDGVQYGSPSGELQLVQSAGAVSAAEVEEEMTKSSDDRAHQGLEPLRLMVPTAGVHFAFEKLYANQGNRDAGFVLPYASGVGRLMGTIALLLGCALTFFGVTLFVRGRRGAAALWMALGLGVLLTMVLRYQVSWTPAVVFGVLVAGGYGVYRWWLGRAVEGLGEC